MATGTDDARMLQHPRNALARAIIQLTDEYKARGLLSTRIHFVEEVEGTDPPQYKRPGLTPQLVEVPENAVWQIDSVEEEEFDFVAKLNSTGGDNHSNYAVGSQPSETPNDINITNNVMNFLSRDANGKTALNDLPEAVKHATDPQHLQQAYDAGQQYNRDALAQRDPILSTQLTPETVRDLRRIRRKHDGSRISKEVHEWRYCIRSSGDRPYVEHYAENFRLVYTPVFTGDPDYPKYGEWCDTDSLREMFVWYRRIKRSYSTCGSKRLWEQQGFASKREAIQEAYLANQEELGVLATDVAERIPGYELVQGPWSFEDIVPVQTAAAEESPAEPRSGPLQED